MPSILKICVVSLFGLLGSPVLAGGIIDPEKPVSDAISQLQNALSALIAQLGSEQRVTMSHALQLVQIALQDFSEVYSDKMNETFKKLDTQQQKAFEDIASLIDDNQKWIHGDIRDGIKTANDLGAVLNKSFLGSGKTLVTGYEPTFLPPEGVPGPDTITLTVSGYELYDAKWPQKPILTIDGKDFTGAAQDTSVSFVIPRSAFKNGLTSPQAERLSLTLFHDEGGWLWGTKIVPLKYDLYYTLLPKDFGSYQVTTKVVVDVAENKPYTSREFEAHGPRDGGKGVSGENSQDCSYPDEGYKFLLSSFKPVIDEHTATLNGVRYDSNNQFTYEVFDGVFAPEKICWAVVAHTDDSRFDAMTKGHFEIIETKLVHNEVTQVGPTVPMDWSDTHFVTPEGATGILTLFILGEPKIEVPLRDPKPLNYLEIRPETGASTVFLSPKHPWEMPWQ